MWSHWSDCYWRYWTERGGRERKGGRGKEGEEGRGQEERSQVRFINSWDGLIINLADDIQQLSVSVFFLCSIADEIY